MKSAQLKKDVVNLIFIIITLAIVGEFFIVGFIMCSRFSGNHGARLAVAEKLIISTDKLNYNQNESINVDFLVMCICQFMLMQ